MEKIKVLVLFGGQSSEHAISELSATNVIANLDTDKYDIYMVGITNYGKWFLYEGNYADIKDGLWETSGKITPAFLTPDASIGGLMVLRDSGAEVIEMDVVSPVLHSRHGADGTIQGLCQLAGLPCVGPDMLSSAICMDKTVSKILFSHLQIPQAHWVTVHSYELDAPEKAVSRIEQAFSYPVFVKPANAGSSVGIGKAKDRESLIECLYTAADHDEKILVEEFIPGKEVECAVLGNRMLTVSHPGQIISAKEFYDYEAKYEIASTIEIPAALPEKTVDTIRDYAARIFRGLGLSGLSRIDFFVCEDGRVLINEVNTIPGFTDISMYPKMLEADGIAQSKQLDMLIDLAVEKYIGSDDSSAAFEGQIHFSIDRGEEERLEFTVPCRYDFDGEHAVLTFCEPVQENGAVVRSKILLTQEACTISRTGDIQTQFTFSKHNLSPFLLEYKMPFGDIQFHILPQEVAFEMSPAGCRARFLYATQQNDVSLHNNLIQFEVTK